MSDNKYKELFDKVEIHSSAKERIENRIYELNFKVEIGETEKHTVEFTYNRFWGYIEIKVDEKPYKKRLVMFLKQSSTYEIKIGQAEKHDVRITLIRGLISVGLNEFTAWVYVDGKIEHDFSGKLTLTGRRFSERNLRNKILIVISAFLLISVIIFSIFYHLPVKINQEFYGVIIRAGLSEPEYYQPIRITVDGKYYKSFSLVSPYSFEGSVHVYERQSDVYKEVYQKKSGYAINLGKPMVMGYIEAIRSFGPAIEGGILYMKPDASGIMIIVFERDEKGDANHAGGPDGLYYVAPCNTREEALNIVNDIRTIGWGKKAALID